MNFIRSLINACGFIVLLTYNIGYPQVTKIVEADYTFFTSESTTIEEAKRIALERAKIQAIADAFGSRISQSATTTVLTNNSRTETQFYMIGTSNIMGEWVETIGYPKFSVNYESSLLVIRCNLKGRIREIAQHELDIEAKILKNGLSDRFESSDFRDGDELFLRFKSSLDGHIIVFLLQNDIVYKLLPYKKSSLIEYPVKAGRNYTFFSKSSQEDANCIDEYVLTADKQIDVASILILYTPNSIGAIPQTTEIYNEPSSMELERFNKWLITKRNKDIYSRVIELPIIIKKL